MKKLYQIVYDYEVESLLTEGWELYGNPFICQQQNSDSFVQAIVKTEEIPDSTPTPSDGKPCS